MSGPVSDVRPVPPKKRRTGAIAAAAASAVAAAIALVMGFVAFWSLARPVPQFTSLTEHPDRSLQGTVAYFADQTRCVRIMAAAGGPAKTVFRVPEMDVQKAVKEGKEIGPQLVWLPDGRLQVTMFRMTPPPKPGAVPAFHRGWQKIVNVHAGSSRTLLSVQGPSDYTYGLGAAFWAPNWQWIAADDGRILIITTGRHPVTRVLTEESSQGAFDADLARFAVTGTNLLTPSK